MTFVFSGNLMRFTSYQKEVALDASTTTHAFAALIERFPDLRSVLFDGDGKLRAVHRVFHNGEQVVEGLGERPLGPSDEISLLTAIAGG